jgi:large subunit ribosomal protein L22
MSQKANPRRVADNEARVKLVSVRISPQKLNLVAQSIRGLRVERALNELEFSRKRIAKDVRKALYSAISNAENNHNLDIDNLVVAEAYVGKGIVMKRFASRARGRSSRIMKPFSELTIVVRESGQETGKEAA